MNNAQAPCPCCGYCPTCGRRNGYWPVPIAPSVPVAPWPGYPSYPSPWWSITPQPGPQRYTITFGDSTATPLSVR